MITEKCDELFPPSRSEHRIRNHAHNLVQAYEANPEAFQRLLAEHKKEAGILLDAHTIRSTGVPAYEEALAKALDGALKPGDSVNYGMREQSWLTVINSIGSENSMWVGGSLGTFANSPVSRMLAQHMRPILDQLARGQAERNAREQLELQRRQGIDNPMMVPHLEPRAPWDTLDLTVTARFMGALMQDPVAANALMKAGTEYIRELDMGRYNPFDADNSSQQAHVNLAERAGAFANLLLAGSTYAEWSDDEFADRIAGFVLMPVDYVDQYFPVPGKIASTGKAKGLDDIKDQLKDIITEYLDKKTPNTARTVASTLVNMQTEVLVRSLKENGHGLLTSNEQKLLRDAMAGRLQGALIDALERRGG